MTWTRRRFLRTAGLASVATLAGCGSRVRIPAEGIRGRTLRLVFYVDVHAKPGVEDALAEAAEAIDGQRADLVIAGGDMVAAGAELSWPEVAQDWAVYAGMRSRLRADVRHVLGNHDLVGPPAEIARGADPRAAYRRELAVAETFYSFDAAGYHVVVLDSVELEGAGPDYRGYVGGDQLDWLRADLDRVGRSRPIVVASHMPLRTGFFRDRGIDRAPPDRVVVNAEEVLDAFEDRNLVCVLQGHLHVAEVLRLGGVAFLTGGAVCGRWWSGSFEGTEPGFAIVTLRPDAVDFQYVGYGEAGAKA